MIRSVAKVHQRTALLVGLALALACGASNEPTSTRFPQGKVRAQQAGLTLEVASANYQAQQVELAIVIRNGTKEALTVESRGILLAYGALEFPIQTDPHAPAAPDIVAANGALQLEVVFVTGTEIREPARLKLRAVRAGERWLPTIAVTIPPMPVSKDEG